MRIILVSHGTLSEGALMAATMLFGENENVSAVGLMPEDDTEVMAEKIVNEIKKTNSENDDIIILSDLYYGSPFNSVITLMRDYNIHHVTGMNLAMIVEVINGMENGDDVEDIIEACQKSAKDGIVDANEMLKSLED